jgi:hypothetical protein
MKFNVLSAMYHYFKTTVSLALGGAVMGIELRVSGLFY